MIRNQKFLKGDRVKIISDCQSYGKCGTVIKCWHNYCSHNNYCEVKLDNGTTHNYNELSLILINEQNNITEGVNKNMLMGNYKVAMVKFVQGTNTTKGYAFALFDNDIKVDDTVLCDSATGYGVAKVTDIIEQKDYEGTQVTKEIICKVDFTAYETRKENRKKAQNLKVQMDKKINEMKELALYEMMAKDCPELAEMLNTYKGLVG